jgi:nickel superoxide dismutase
MKSVLIRTAALATVLFATTTTSAFAHCEIPCGIYGDDTRFAMIAEDIQTIEKSMLKIEELSADVKGNINQITRWVNNKEHHADHIREVVTQYFMTQRIKVPAAGDAAAMDAYTRQLTLLHKMLVSAMKCKQTTDVANTKALHDLAHEFKAAYTK